MDCLEPLPTDFTIGAVCARDLNGLYKAAFPAFPATASTSPTALTVPYYIQGPVEQTSCYPSNYAGNTQQYYSPALCPTGFTAPCRSEYRTGTIVETVLTCCPTQENYQCQTAPLRVWESTLGCTSMIDSVTTIAVSQVMGGSTLRTTQKLITTDGINAYSIQVRYQSTDFVMSTTATPVASSSSRDTETATSTPYSTSRDTIRGGTIAGVVVGVVAGIFTAVVSIFLLIRRCQRQRHPNPVRRHQQTYPYQVRQNDQQCHQLDSHKAPHELQTYEIPAELEHAYQDKQNYQQYHQLDSHKAGPGLTLAPHELQTYEMPAELDSTADTPRSRI
ncbi:hypothetical protein F5Y19DRAFT_487142 [Xylariaceae sp. FL1651]|nr:hypothetical protein F5Y19DRAFT_487142 [Xylariaceae sp. FL1651]